VVDPFSGAKRPAGVDRRRGRHLFGRDPERYDRSRPEYPSALFRRLETRCGLRPGCAVFEIGAGTGKASRELLRRGANPLWIVEPDRRMVRFLRRSLAPWRDRVRFVVAPFEAARLPAGRFDLGVAATSFHWTRERAALAKVARLVRPGGWWAVWWSLSGDPTRPSRLSAALDPVFDRLPSTTPNEPPRRLAYYRGRRRRLTQLASAGPFDRVRVDTYRWVRRRTTAELLDLYRTFSNLSTLSPRVQARFYAEVARVVNGRFRGRANLPVIVTMYTARRRPVRGRPAATTRRRARRASPTRGVRRRPARRRPAGGPRRTALARSTPPSRGSS
jgi:SAM-dependent methyltransferase